MAFPCPATRINQPGSRLTLSPDGGLDGQVPGLPGGPPVGAVDGQSEGAGRHDGLAHTLLQGSLHGRPPRIAHVCGHACGLRVDEAIRDDRGVGSAVLM